MGWQPIETAARDGKEVLLADNEGGVCAGSWDSLWRDSETRRMGCWLWREEVELRPTHWMPLPEPPKVGS